MDEERSDAGQRFGEFTWLESAARLSCGSEVLLSGGRAAEVLRVLIAERHRPVPKDELLDAVWPDQDVEEGNLAVQVSTLRRLLGPQAIATVPGRGYHFVLQAGAAAAPPAPTPVVAAQARHNLSPHLAPLIGREAELAELQADLAQAPLLTLVGEGGIGKTRLAAALAATQVERHPDGVWWVDLAQLADAERVAWRVGIATGVPMQHVADPLQALAQGLRHRRLLLVLDNCEHLQPACAALAQALLQAAPGVRVLATSQEPLHLSLERVYRLGRLRLPPAGASLDEARRCGALALLLDRAQATDRRFRLAPADLPAAIGICAQLEGNALALTLAAARLPWMGVHGVRDRLADRLQLLAQQQGDAPLRHRSLQAALQWSHALLGTDAQAALRRLAVFRGGFTLELGSEVVASAGAVPGWQAVELIGTLVDKSMLQVEEGSPLRYRLPESMRLYGLRQLDAHGEAEQLARHHRQAMVRLAGRAMRDLWCMGDRAWMAAYEPDLENLGVAMSQAVADGRADDAARLYETLSWLARMRSSGHGLRQWADAALSLADGSGDAAAAASLHLTLAGLWRNQSPARAKGHYERALHCLGDCGDAAERFKASCGMAICCARLGQAQLSEQLLVQARTLLRPDWPARLRMLEADAAAFQAHGMGDLGAARQHFTRFRELSLQCEAEGGVAVVTHNLVDIALTMGDVDDAVRLGRAAVAWLRSRPSNYNLGFSLGNLLAALVRAGCLDEALQAAREGLPLLRLEDQAFWLFDHLALLTARRGRPHDAARLSGHGEAYREAAAAVREPNEVQAHALLMEHLRAALPAPELQALLNEGRSLPAAQADVLALEVAPHADHPAAVGPGAGGSA